MAANLSRSTAPVQPPLAAEVRKGRVILTRGRHGSGRFSVQCSPGRADHLRGRLPAGDCDPAVSGNRAQKNCECNVPRGLVEGFELSVPSRRHADHRLHGSTEGSPQGDHPILIETDRFIRSVNQWRRWALRAPRRRHQRCEYSDRLHPQCIRDRPSQLHVLLSRQKPTNQLAVFCLPAGAASHSFSFDHRRRPETLRTAIATAFFWPTSTTSCFPRVTPV